MHFSSCICIFAKNSTLLYWPHFNRTSAETVQKWVDICILEFQKLQLQYTSEEYNSCYPTHISPTYSRSQLEFKNRLLKWISIDGCHRNKVPESSRNLWIVMSLCVKELGLICCYVWVHGNMSTLIIQAWTLWFNIFMKNLNTFKAILRDMLRSAPWIYMLLNIFLPFT